jgi:hypothetical protein
MKILLLTTEPQWKSWNRKLSACRGGLGLVKNIGSVTIDIQEHKGDVPTTGGKVDRAWFNVLTMNARTRGYQAVVLHMSESKAKGWGVKQSLRGATINDEMIGELYIIADEDSMVKYPSGLKVNRFIKVFLHEMSHWMSRTLGQEDKTHYYDYEMESVWRCMKDYGYPQGFIERITSALRKEYVVMPASMDVVSQHFGVASSMYKSGIHAGIDLPLKTGTPVLAPTDGHVRLVWNNHKDLGNACTFEFFYNGKMYTLRLAHLSKVPNAGGFRRGDVIAYTGNTGKSTGAHLHMEVWKVGYDATVLLKEKTIRECLVNPYIFFRGITN